jgi:hypothetical protein
MPLAAGHQAAAGQRGLEVLVHVAGDVDGRAGDVRRSQRPPALPACRPTRCGEERGGNSRLPRLPGECCTSTSRPFVMISSWSGKIFTKRPHPWAACYRTASTGSPELPVTTDHRVAIFVPEPVFRSPLTWGTATRRRRAPEAQIWAAPPASTQDRSRVQNGGTVRVLLECSRHSE